MPKQSSTPTNQLRWLWLTALIFLLDQSSKWLVRKYFVLGKPLVLLPFFNLSLAHNFGAAYGFLRFAGGWQRWFFIGVAILVCTVLLYTLEHLEKARNWTACAMALILGGAIGNLYDRIVHVYVTDFFDFHLNTWHFATFNVADSAISVGVVMWILASFKKQPRGKLL